MISYRVVTFRAQTGHINRRKNHARPTVYSAAKGLRGNRSTHTCLRITQGPVDFLSVILAAETTVGRYNCWLVVVLMTS